VEPESAKAFSRTIWGYNASAVDAHIEMMTTKQQLVLDDVESLRARLKDLEDESAALRNEIALLTETSSAPHAVQQRMAQMLRRAVDEAAEMQAEARAEAEALIAAAETEAQAAQQKQKELLAEMDAQLKAREAEYAKAKETLNAELDRMRSDAERERELLLANAVKEAAEYRDQVRREVAEASQQRIKVLEELMGVYRDLEAVPAALESAYQEAKNPPESTD
jgi:cell division septum initiation protein DivIVA